MTRNYTTHVDHIIETTVLGDWTQRRLVVCSGVDRGNTVNTLWKPFGDGVGHLVVHSSGINTQEEGKLCWVSGSGVCQTIDFLNNKVRVANDVLGLWVDLLWSGVVVGICVDKVTGYQIREYHCN